MSEVARSTRRSACSLAIAALALAGCTGTAQTTLFDAGPQDDSGPVQGLGLNDVSILFPLGADAGSVELVSVSASGERGVLLPEDLYDSLGHITGSTFIGPISPGAQGDALYSNLYVVAARIDPCFASLEPDPTGASCLNQLRLIVQEVTLQDGAPAAFDSALHLFYSLSRDELKTFARGVLALRLASGGVSTGPLAPHPLLSAQGLEGPFASGLRALILQFAGAQRLTRVTRFSNHEPEFWVFDGFDLSSTLDSTHLIIPTLPDAANTQTFTLGANPANGGDMNGQFLPETTASADLAPLAGSNTAQLTAPARQAAFNALVQIENPALFSPNTIDCASCHLATPTELLVAAPQYGFHESGNDGAFAPDLRFVAASALLPTFNPGAQFNLHAFSYVAGTPAINQRVVNESAAIVAYLATLP
jgi:hypothetical protein